ncbi:hypothetical protein GCM10010112_55850 [Actinoplanes lobatus]|uniref:Uncharacterized protein n=2 Tax=Actinoplanes lobatus TaxID=113568 RepID=A0ABQ4AWW6_9ACTN|nr:hypothetical protein GCM10010112_55850 [Actinoplanes lobatus]GIE45245.1 hypothetical protein Alo02nite_81430 [Actinoplanes lobatus]
MVLVTDDVVLAAGAAEAAVADRPDSSNRLVVMAKPTLIDLIFVPHGFGDVVDATVVTLALV